MRNRVSRDVIEKAVGNGGPRAGPAAASCATPTAIHIVDFPLVRSKTWESSFASVTSA